MISEYTRQAAANIVGQMDAKISGFLGHDWTSEEIKRRCRLVSVSGIPYQTLYVDDRPVLDIYPIQCEQEMKDDRIVMRFTQQYRELTKEISSDD